MRNGCEPRRLPEDAPNILIVLIDDAGPGLPTTFGGEVRTDTLTRIHAEGIGYNRFHTTAMCSPDAGVAADRPQPSPHRQRPDRRAGQRLGRLRRGDPEEQRAGGRGAQGTTATATAAWGKWHNTPAVETTAAGPFDNWPTEIGFEYFYGFLAGEASQYEPNLVRNTTVCCRRRPPEEGYHLSEDLADDAIGWLRRHKAFEPGQAVLHVLGQRLPARPAPRDEGVGRQVRRQVRRRLGRLPGAGLRTAPRRWAGSRPDAELTPRDPHDAGLGRHPRGGAAVPAPADGGRRRLRRARRRPGRAG